MRKTTTGMTELATGGRESARPLARSSFVFAVVALMFQVTTAAADEPSESTVSSDEANVSSEMLEVFADKAPLSGDELNTQRAKAVEVDRVQINDQETVGGVWNNTATGNDTGNNIISEGAFTDTAGFVGTIQNTGNNVLIQNSTIINVAVEP